MSIEIKEVDKLHLFSESSHYVCAGKPNLEGKIPFKHLESGQLVELSTAYVEQFLRTADQFVKVQKVGKEDKLWTAKQIEAAFLANEIKANEVVIGDVRVKGIRTIWEEIHSTQVFTVCFIKQGKPLAKKEYQQLLDTEVAKVMKASKGAYAARDIKAILENPVSAFEAGERRVLRGYKVQFTSRDGRYNCIDVDLPENDPAKKIRPVNINTLEWLVFDGVKYEVE